MYELYKWVGMMDGPVFLLVREGMVVNRTFEGPSQDCDNLDFEWYQWGGKEGDPPKEHPVPLDKEGTFWNAKYQGVKTKPVKSNRLEFLLISGKSFEGTIERYKVRIAQR